ncbi:PQQ-dependent sugar dehydrogenase [Marinicella sp. W31]|uniref:PQQ-dependent sugar dehydrogenase n=1 Tax=Marinicella sp. W31 TaxID=3023713 RepID=UPI00375696B5
MKATLGEPKYYDGQLPSLAALNIRDARLDKLISGLNYPWAFEIIDADTVIITELSGKLSYGDLRSGQLTTIEGLPDIASNDNQMGLLDVALHPKFSSNKHIYISYVATDTATGQYQALTVSMGRLENNRLVGVKTIFQAQPTWSPSNFGGAMAFDNAGYLYISVGDRSEPETAQNLNHLQGKILRLRDDGGIPKDNPFIQDATADDRIYAYGVRNPQGLDFDHVNGLLYESEHGPMGGDEVNIIRPGHNYGWPRITYGISYTTEKIGQGTHQKNMQQPVFYYLPSEAVSPLAVYRGSMFSEWDGDVLLGMLKGKHISHLDIDDAVVRSEYPLLQAEINARIRDIKIAVDGAVLILTQTGDLYRLHRQPQTQQAKTPRAEGQVIYDLVCAGCHDTGANNAPVLGNMDDWREILKQPVALTYDRSLKGYNDMPERGLCYLCQDDDIKRAVDYMLDSAKDKQK